jgi:hypothetical protein
MSGRTSAVLATLVFFAASASLAAQQPSAASLKGDLERLRVGEQIANLPPADSVAPGARSVAAGTTVKNTIVARGPVDVFGRVEGSVVSLTGDVTVHRGGVVTGDALAVGGRVVADSGEVDGELRAVSVLPALVGPAAAVADIRTPTQRTADSVRTVAGSFAILLIIALGVFLFAGPNLEEVVSTIQGRFVRVFWYGILAQLLVLPGLLVVIVALALTVIGILLIPFAVVAYGIAGAGLATLGFLAVSRLVGAGLWHGGTVSARGRALGALFVGVSTFFALWLVASLLVWSPFASTIMRAAAAAATWAAMTLGLGAAILSRAGTHLRVTGSTRPIELAAWQTPTPVAGVVAARRTAGVGKVH